MSRYQAACTKPLHPPSLSSIPTLRTRRRYHIYDMGRGEQFPTYLMHMTENGPCVTGPTSIDSEWISHIISRWSLPDKERMRSVLDSVVYRNLLEVIVRNIADDLANATLENTRRYNSSNIPLCIEFLRNSDNCERVSIGPYILNEDAEEPTIETVNPEPPLLIAPR
jgi:hypothetical protein